MKECGVKIKYEKSALQNFADKYVVEGKSGFKLYEYFKDIAPKFKDLLIKEKYIT